MKAAEFNSCESWREVSASNKKKPPTVVGRRREEAGKRRVGCYIELL